MIKYSDKFLILLLILTYLLFLIPQTGKLFVADETVFVKAAKNISEGGGPMYVDKGNQVSYALWHPTLYIHVLSASFKLFGVSEVSARIVSAIFVLGTFFLIYKIYSNKSVLLAGIFLLNPFVIQNSLLVDIDNSILTFLMVLFVYLYLKLDENKLRNLIFLGILFGTTLWAKFGTPPVLIIGIFLYHSLNGDVKRGLGNSITILAIGASFFVLSWWLYTSAFNLPFWAPVMHNLWYLSSRDIVFTIYSRLWAFKNLLFWATPFFFILAFLAMVERIKNYLTQHKPEKIDFILITSVLIFIEYGILIDSRAAQDYPKYLAPMMPLFSIVIAGYIDGLIGTQEKTEKLFIIGIIFVAYFFFILGDPLLSEQAVFISSSISEIASVISGTLLLYILPFFFGILLVRIFTHAGWKKNIVLSATICLLSFSIYTGFVQSHADYSTIYGYGEKGMKKTIDYLNSHAKPTDIILSREDIAYYSDVYTYYDIPSNAQELAKLERKVRISYIIIPQRGFFSRIDPGMNEYIESGYNPVKGDFGSFRVYEKKA